MTGVFTTRGKVLATAVLLILGAAFAGLVSQFPQLVWLSEHKKPLFLIAGLALAVAGLSQWKARNLPCPLDAAEARACARARKWSNATYAFSVVIFLIGVGFAFIPELLSSNS